jgi:hypothetical protein
VTLLEVVGLIGLLKMLVGYPKRELLVGGPKRELLVGGPKRGRADCLNGFALVF